MLPQESPGGSTFPYYYKGGEIHCLKYGSFYSDEDALLDLMKQEEAFIASRPNRKLSIWVDFYKTKLTERVLVGFAESIGRLQANITKLAVVGVSFRDRWRMQRVVKRTDTPPIALRFFDDPEDAKTWLVGGGRRGQD